MNSFQKQMAAIPLVKRLSSLKIMVTCLALLFILTFWGTIAQVQHGLYLSQARYFNSFFFLVFGFIPFPGAQLVMWVLFVNLLCAALFRFAFDLKHLGILIIHFGLLTYLVAAFVTLYSVKESQLTLQEGETSNLSSAYHQWEIAVWKKTKEDRKVIAYDSNRLKPQEVLDFGEFDFTLKVQSYYLNTDAYTGEAKGDQILNASGIATLKPLEPQNEPEKNTPGAILEVVGKQAQSKTLIVFGGESNPTELTLGNATYEIILRRKRIELPITVRLKDFQVELYPNTEVASSYKSLVTITANGLSRDVLISMNNPLRYKNYTFYQSSYSIDKAGRKSSTLAVVSNSGRLLPYISSLLTFLGLTIHFLSKAFLSKKPSTTKVRTYA